MSCSDGHILNFIGASLVTHNSPRRFRTIMEHHGFNWIPELRTCAQSIIQHCSHLLTTLAQLSLMLAAQQMLLEHGATTNKADSDGVTSLLACIEAVHSSTARLAIDEVGANHHWFQDSMCTFKVDQTCAFCLLPLCNQSSALPSSCLLLSACHAQGAAICCNGDALLL